MGEKQCRSPNDVKGYVMIRVFKTGFLPVDFVPIFDLHIKPQQKYIKNIGLFKEKFITKCTFKEAKPQLKASCLIKMKVKKMCV